MMNDIRVIRWNTAHVRRFGRSKKQHDLNTIENASMHIHTFVYTGVPGVIGRRLTPNPEIDLSLNCLFASRRSCEGVLSNEIVIIFF